MNISQISSQLSYLPDQALIQEMQNPSGAVPQFLVLSELQRRQQTRAGASQGPAPTQTVAQDVMGQQPRPPVGPGLGQPPMVPPQSSPVAPRPPDPRIPQAAGGLGGIRRMASGGIVQGDGYDPTTMQFPSYDYSQMFAQHGRMWDPNLQTFVRPPETSGGKGPPVPNIAGPQMPQASLPQFNVAQGLPGITPDDVSAAAPRPDPSGASLQPPQGAGTGIRSIGNAGAPGAAPPTATDEDLMNLVQKVTGMFPPAQGTGAQQAKIAAELDQDHQQAPWMALAKAGFKMASGTSPSFATNAGAGLEGIPDELQQHQTEYLKGQLELAGLSSKEAEAEATRRVNIANIATKFEDARQRATELAYNSQNQLQAHEDQVASTAAYRNASLMQHQEYMGSLNANREQQRLDAQQRTAAGLHENWMKQFKVGDPTSFAINPDTKQPYKATDSPYYQQALGGVAPAALAPRTLPSTVPPASKRPIGTIFNGHRWTGVDWVPQ